MFPVQYSNISITACKNSGKSNLVYRIVENCTNRYTQVLIFAATVNKDPVYKKMIKMLTKCNIDTVASTDFLVDEIDLHAEFMGSPPRNERTEKPEEKLKLDIFPEAPVRKSKKKAIDSERQISW